MAFPILPLVGAVLPSIVGAIKDKISPPQDTLGKDAFLKLLVEQIRHQDPLNPLSNAQFISQTASFSSLEELQNIRKALEGASGSGAGSVMAASTAFIGRPVAATSAGFTYAGATVNLPFALESPVGSAAVEVSDARGNVVARVPLGPRAAGAHSFDLTPGSAGRLLPAGQYRYRILSLDAAGSTPLPAITGTVTGVAMEGGVPVLTMGSRRVSLADVAAVVMSNN